MTQENETLADFLIDVEPEVRDYLTREEIIEMLDHGATEGGVLAAANIAHMGGGCGSCSFTFCQCRMW